LLIASSVFKAYVDEFSDYGALYGGLGGVIVLLLWLFALGWSILFGAELNDVLGHEGGAASPKQAPASCPVAPQPNTSST
jgi:membrane protein